MKRFLILCATLVGLIVAAHYAPRNEVDRLQQHFRTVHRELVRRDVSALTDAQRAARLVLIEQLRRAAYGRAWSLRRSVAGSPFRTREPDGSTGIGVNLRL